MSAVDTGAAQETQAARPAGVTALAVITALMMVTGMLGIPFSLALAFFVPGPTQQLIANHDFYRLWLLGSSAVGWTGAFVAIFGCVGLWMLQPWGRLVVLAHAVFVILTLFANTLVNVFVLFPFLYGWEGPERQSALTGAAVGVAGSFLGLLLPIAQLIVLTRPSIKAAFVRT